MPDSIGPIARETGDGSTRRGCPQRSNFISWSELVANTVAGGEVRQGVAKIENTVPKGVSICEFPGSLGPPVEVMP